MPVLLDTPRRAVRGGSETLQIGLLNNLGDNGLEGGERQFIDLLEAAAGSSRVRLRLFSLPSIARGPDAAARIAASYHGIDTLLADRLDGLFVTGAEPRAADLRGEAFWPDLSLVIDWAGTNTVSTIWSCLAAHAAVLHLDGIVRHPLPEKCSGRFAVDRASDHSLLDGTGPDLRVCHSRWNDLDEGELRAAGYEILTRGEVGVDSFVARRGSLFVFFQGHPEYDAGALGREYRRDVRRFVAGESTLYPRMPRHYFDASDEARLAAFENDARRGRASLLPVVAAPGPWRRDFADRMLTNWLRMLSGRAARAA